MGLQFAHQLDFKGNDLSLRIFYIHYYILPHPLIIQPELT